MKNCKHDYDIIECDSYGYTSQCSKCGKTYTYDSLDTTIENRIKAFFMIALITTIIAAIVHNIFLNI